MAEIEIRKMLPSRRGELPAFEISLDGQVIGRVHQTALRGAVNAFFRAVGVFPGTTRKVDLQLNTDLQDRVDTVVRFHDYPQESERHLLHDLRCPRA